MRALADELSRGAAARREELIDLVRTLASVDAPSGSGPDALAAAADVVAGCLRLPGARLSRIPGTQGDLLELELGPQSSDRTLVLGHYDTVWPAGTAAQRPFKLDGDVITGPGVFDMRGGLAVAICALRLLGPQRLPLRTTVLVTPDEETGSAGSQRQALRAEQSQGADRDRQAPAHVEHAGAGDHVPVELERPLRGGARGPNGVVVAKHERPIARLRPELELQQVTLGPRDARQPCAGKP